MSGPSGPAPIVEVDVFTALVEIPLSGDDVTAEGVAVYMQAITNRSRYTQKRMTLGDRDVYTQVIDDDLAQLARYDQASYALATSGTNTPAIIISSLKAGDVVSVMLTMNYKFLGSSGDFSLQLWAFDAQVSPGVPITGGRLFGDDFSASPKTNHGTITGVHRVVNPGNLLVSLKGQTSGTHVTLLNAFSFTATVFHAST